MSNIKHINDGLGLHSFIVKKADSYITTEDISCNIDDKSIFSTQFLITEDISCNTEVETKDIYPLTIENYIKLLKKTEDSILTNISVNLLEEYIKLLGTKNKEKYNIDLYQIIENIELSDEISRQQKDLIKQVITNILVNDNVKINQAKINDSKQIYLNDSVLVKKNVILRIDKIEGNYEGRVNFNVYLYGNSNAIDVCAEYLYFGNWKNALLSDSENLAVNISSSSSSCSLSSSSLSSSSNSFQSSCSFSSSSNSLSSSSLSSSSFSISSISSSSCSTFDVYRNKYQIWWNADSDLYKNLITKLRIFIKGSELKQETDLISIDEDLSQNQMVILGLEQKYTDNSDIYVSYVPINVYGFMVSQIQFKISQYIDDRAIRKYIDLSQLTNECVLYENSYLRIKGDVTTLYQEWEIVKNGLIFAVDLKNKKDWKKHRLLKLQGQLIEDRFERNDYAVNFSNTNDKLELVEPIDLSVLSEYTICLWFKYPLEQSVSSWNTLIGDENTIIAIVRKSDSRLGFYKGGFIDSGYELSNLSNDWHFLIIEVNGDNTKYYIDNEYVGMVYKVSNDYIKVIGNYINNNEQFGNISDIRIYSRVLTKDEKQELFYLNGQYDYEQGIITDIIDAGQNVKWYSFEADYFLDENTSIDFYFRTCLDEEGKEQLIQKEWIKSDYDLTTLKIGRWLEWKVILKTDAYRLKTPKLYNLNFNFENVAYLTKTDWLNCYPNSFRYDNYTDWIDINKNGDFDIVGSIIRLGGNTQDGYISDIIDAKRDVNWGKIEKKVLNQEVDIYVRVATNNEGKYALINKSFVKIQDEINIYGRYLEWKIEFNYQNSELDYIIFWCWNKKKIYRSKSDWQECSNDGNIIFLDEGIELKENVTEAVISDVIEIECDEEWLYCITDSNNSEIYYRIATYQEGREKLASKTWNLVNNKTILANGKYLEWKIILKDKLKVLIFSWNKNEIQNQYIHIDDVNSGALKFLALSESGEHSKYQACRDESFYFLVDKNINISNTLLPVFEWNNVSDIDKPQQKIKYLFQLNKIDLIDDVNRNYIFEKSSQSELSAYIWKDNSIVINNSELYLDKNYNIGRIVYRVGGEDKYIWKNILINMNLNRERKDIDIRQWVRVSDNLQDWTNWQEIRKSYNILEKSKYLELKIEIRRNFGVFIPKITKLQVTALLGNDKYIVSETQTKTRFYVQNELLNNTYYFYRVLAFDGVDFSLWSKANLLYVDVDNLIIAPSGLQVEHEINPTHVITFNPYFDWIFAEEGHQQEKARLQVGISDGLWEIWDTGKTIAPSGLYYNDNISNEIVENKDLIRGKKYLWRVKVWDELGRESNFSDVNYFKLNRKPTKPILIKAQN